MRVVVASMLDRRRILVGMTMRNERTEEQGVIDPSSFTGPNDPKIGGSPQHADPVHRAIMWMFALFALGIGIPVIFGLFVGPWT
jgi:hypothetical protein